MNHPTNTVLTCAGVSWTACPRRNIKRGICVLPCDSCTQHRNLFLPPRIPKSVWVAGEVCSVLPDLDVIGFRFGVHYGDFWGHRGFTHSLVFAALIASAALVLVFRDSVPKIGRFPLFLYLFLATASHGLLDAMTNGGLGVAFFSPFNNHRYFLPWRPIRVSPIAVTRFFSRSEEHTSELQSPHHLACPLLL